MINKASVVVYIGHYPETPIKEIIKTLYPIEYKEIILKVKKWKVDFKLALAAYLLKEEPFCKVCGKGRLQKTTFALRETCSKSCRYLLQKDKIKETKLKNADAVFKILLAKKLPWTTEHIKLIKNACIGNKNGKWYEMVINKLPSTIKKYNSAEPINFNVQHFEYFLINLKLKKCVECDKILVHPNSNRCMGTCASIYGGTKAIKVIKLKYGNSGFAVKKFADLAKSTMLENHGVEYTAQSELLRVKMGDTMELNSGVRNACDLPSTKAALKERYNDKDWVQAVVKKGQDTKQERYGDDWRTIGIDKMIHARYKIKKVELQGIEFNVQGYEPYVLKELVARGCNAKNIETYVITYPYINPKTKRKALYRPDIIVAKKDLVIEVKSTYTAGLYLKTHDMWKQLVVKSKAVAAAGDVLLLSIVNPKLGIFNLKEPHLYTRKQVEKLLNYKPFTFVD